MTSNGVHADLISLFPTPNIFGRVKIVLWGCAKRAWRCRVIKAGVSVAPAEIRERNRARVFGNDGAHVHMVFLQKEHWQGAGMKRSCDEIKTRLTLVLIKVSLVDNLTLREQTDDFTEQASNMWGAQHTPATPLSAKAQDWHGCSQKPCHTSAFLVAIVTDDGTASHSTGESLPGRKWPQWRHQKWPVLKRTLFFSSAAVTRHAVWKEMLMWPSKKRRSKLSKVHGAES